jgi:UTP--glucose-1-phosphate uridylyltransferase
MCCRRRSLPPCGIATLIAEGQPFDALRFTGQHFDCGNKLGYLQATLALGLRHAEVGVAFKEHVLALAHHPIK